MPRTGSVDRFGAGGRALDLCGARADLAGLAAGECPGAVDRGDGAAHTGYTDPALGNASFSSIARSSRPSWPSGRTTRSCSSTRAIAVERRDWPTALGHLQRSLRGSAPTDSIVRKLFALIARCHQMLGELPSALNACSEGLRMDPDDAELHFRKAVLHRKAGQPAEAEAGWRRILTLKCPTSSAASTRASTATSPCAVRRPGRGTRRPDRGPAALEAGPRRVSRRYRGHVARGNVTVSRGACRHTWSARHPQLQPGRSQETPTIPLRR